MPQPASLDIGFDWATMSVRARACLARFSWQTKNTAVSAQKWIIVHETCVTASTAGSGGAKRQTDGVHAQRAPRFWPNSTKEEIRPRPLASTGVPPATAVATCLSLLLTSPNCGRGEVGRGEGLHSPCLRAAAHSAWSAAPTAVNPSASTRAHPWRCRPTATRICTYRKGSKSLPGGYAPRRKTDILRSHQGDTL